MVDQLVEKLRGLLATPARRCADDLAGGDRLGEGLEAALGEGSVTSWMTSGLRRSGLSLP